MGNLSLKDRNNPVGLWEKVELVIFPPFPDTSSYFPAFFFFSPKHCIIFFFPNLSMGFGFIPMWLRLEGQLQHFGGLVNFWRITKYQIGFPPKPSAGVSPRPAPLFYE